MRHSRTRPDERHLARPRTDNVAPLPSRHLAAAAPVGRTYLARRYDVRVHHVERVPGAGPVLMASNHLGVLDGPVLVAHAPRPVHTLVKREMFDGWLGKVGRALGQIPVERLRVDPRAIKLALRVLRDGGVVGIYPEGSRGAGDVAHSRLGVAYLGLCTGAPILPVACLGTREPGASISALPRRGTRIDLVFGEPFSVDPVEWPRTKLLVAATAETVRRRLADHVQDACALTGQRLPGKAPDELRDAADRSRAEVGPEAGEMSGR